MAYDTVQVAMDQMEHKAPEFVQSVNPFGKLPVITMANGKPLIESGAQLCYLAEVFDTNVKSPEDLAIVSQWCMFANARWAGKRDCRVVRPPRPWTHIYHTTVKN